MEELKIYVSGIVLAAFASGIAFMLMPKGKLPKYVRISASVCIMLLLLSPIHKLSGEYKGVLTSQKQELPSNYTKLSELQHKLIITDAKNRFSASTEEILRKNGITPKAVHIYVSADGEEISLDSIEIIMPDSLTAPQKSKARRLITEVFGIEPSISIER